MIRVCSIPKQYLWDASAADAHSDDVSAIWGLFRVYDDTVVHGRVGGHYDSSRIHSRAVARFDASPVIGQSFNLIGMCLSVYPSAISFDSVRKSFDVLENMKLP